MKIDLLYIFWSKSNWPAPIQMSKKITCANILSGWKKLFAPTADYVKKVPSVYTHSMKTIYLSLSAQVQWIIPKKNRFQSVPITALCLFNIQLENLVLKNLSVAEGTIFRKSPVSKKQWIDYIIILFSQKITQINYEILEIVWAPRPISPNPIDLCIVILKSIYMVGKYIAIFSKNNVFNIWCTI